MPGFGNSDLLATGNSTTRDLSTLARRLMDALNMERVHGVGTSYGTVILADLARPIPIASGA